MYSKESINQHIKDLETATKKTKACTKQLKELMTQLAYLEGLRSNKKLKNDQTN